MAMSKDNKNGTDLMLDGQPKPAQKTVLDCSFCRFEETYFTKQLEGKVHWVCGRCKKQNPIKHPIPAKLKKYRMVLNLESVGPYIVSAHKVSRSDGCFEFWVDNELAYIVNQNDVQSLLCMDSEAMLVLDL